MAKACQSARPTCRNVWFRRSLKAVAQVERSVGVEEQQVTVRHVDEAERLVVGETGDGFLELLGLLRRSGRERLEDDARALRVGRIGSGELDLGDDVRGVRRPRGVALDADVEVVDVAGIERANIGSACRISMPPEAARRGQWRAFVRPDRACRPPSRRQCLRTHRRRRPASISMTSRNIALPVAPARSSTWLRR